jgi:hypothetical protein
MSVVAKVYYYILDISSKNYSLATTELSHLSYTNPSWLRMISNSGLLHA